LDANPHRLSPRLFEAYLEAGEYGLHGMSAMKTLNIEKERKGGSAVGKNFLLQPTIN
jgi:hypothetical protein